jgi:hypothetical protein
MIPRRRTFLKRRVYFGRQETLSLWKSKAQNHIYETQSILDICTVRLTHDTDSSMYIYIYLYDISFCFKHFLMKL